MMPTVIEQQDAAPAAPAPTAPPMWYYCTSPAGYFPYVQACNRAWIPVTPRRHRAARRPDRPALVFRLLRWREVLSPDARPFRLDHGSR
jgi:hypothetical protein